MNRKHFLKTVATLATVTALPTAVVSEWLIDNKEFVPNPEGFTIDYSTKTISYVGSEKSITVYDLYNYLKDQWDNDYMPIVSSGKPQTVYIDEFKIKSDRIQSLST